MKRSPELLLSSCSSSSTSSSSSSSSVGGFESPNGRRKRTSSTMKPKPLQDNTTFQKQSTGSRRSSIYRGVTRHRLTGRFEAHLWDKSSWNSVQTKKGRQVYLGAYDIEETAARTYDLAALKYWGKDAAILNFPIETYSKEIEEMDMFSREEFLASLRRHSNGFSRGVSKYRGVARHHHNGRWEARIGRVNGSKYIYLGTFETQEEAAEAYDKAALEYRGVNAVTNFDKRKYKDQIANKSEQCQVEQVLHTTTSTTTTTTSASAVAAATTITPPSSEVTQKQDQCNSISVPLMSMDQSTPISTSLDEQDLPWNFMDGVLPQDSSRAEDLLSIFYNADFHDADIEFLFSSEPVESDFNLSAVLDSFGSEDVVMNGNAAGSNQGGCCC